jgi:uncharacterized membrane protein
MAKITRSELISKLEEIKKELNDFIEEVEEVDEIHDEISDTLAEFAENFQFLSDQSLNDS